MEGKEEILRSILCVEGECIRVHYGDREEREGGREGVRERERETPTFLHCHFFFVFPLSRKNEDAKKVIN